MIAMPGSKVTCDGVYNAIGAQGINLSQLWDLINPLDQIIKFQLLQSRPLGTPQILASEAIMLAVLLRNYHLTEGLSSRPFHPSQAFQRLGNK